MIDFVELRQWILGTALLFFAYALYYEYAKSQTDRIRRKLLSVGAVVFIIGSVFATISAQKSGCPGGEPNDDGTGGIAGLLIPSRMVNDAALLRNMSDAESDSEEGAALSLTNRISFDSFAITSTSRVFGIGWSQGLSSYFPLLDLAYKKELTNDEWSVFMTEDIGGSMTNGVVLEIATDQMPTNAVADKGFYAALMRKDPNPLRNTDGDYFTDIEELGEANIISGDGYLWFDIALTGSDLLFPYYQRADLEADVDFQSPHVFNGIAYSGARVTLDGWVYFRDAALARINTDSCPIVRLFGIEPMVDAWNWGSGVYFGTVVNDGRTYDVIEYLNVGMYDYMDEPVSPLLSCEVIIPWAEPDAIYVSYANVDDEIRNVDSWLGYANTALESVFVSNGYYQIEYPVGTPRPVPYTTVRYHIGSGTDPRVYDDYTPPICGQTAAERAFVETSVGHNLTNGLYELTASVTEDPVVPVRITVGDRSVTMTNRGECVFLCEKGVQYQLAISPSYFSSIEFSARDDIAPPRMMAGAGGSAGAAWTVDNRLTLVPPTGSAFGSCLWLPTLTAGPNVLEHWYPDDGGMRFTAYLTDYPGSNSVSYAWSCADDNVHIASPSAQSTMVSLRNSPGWGSTDLSVTATVDGYTLSSTLANLEYGTHSSPQVSFSLEAPEVVFLNDDDRTSRWYRVALDFGCDVETNATITLSHTGSTGIRFAAKSNGGRPLSWNAVRSRVADLPRTLHAEFYMACSDIDRGYFTAECELADGDVLVVSNRYQVIEPLRKLVCTDPAPNGGYYNPSRLVYGTNAWLTVGVNGGFSLDDVEWRIISGPGEFVSTSRNFACVRATAPQGTVVVEAAFGNDSAIQPRFVLPIVSQRAIPVKVFVVGSNTVSSASISEKFAYANKIFGQVGIYMDVISITNNVGYPSDYVVSEYEQTTNSDGRAIKALSSQAKRILDFYSVGDCIEVYLVGRIIAGRAVAFQTKKGIIVSNDASTHVISHEIGHCLGLEDCYVNRRTVARGRIWLEQYYAPVSRGFMQEPVDWGPELERGFYEVADAKSLVHCKLLMYGVDGKDGVDIPSADVLSLTKKATSSSDTQRSRVGADYIHQNNEEVYSQ